MTIKRTPEAEPPRPPKGSLADMVNEGGAVEDSSELSRDPAQRQRSESERDVEDTEDIRR